MATDDGRRVRHQQETCCKYLLGVVDEEITENNRHLATWSTSKLGGKPDFMCPEASTPGCKFCNRTMALVVQVYAPIDRQHQHQHQVPSYHRTLYIFACLVCSSSRSIGSDKSECWRVLRSQQPESVTGEPQPSNDLPAAASDWLDSADDWGPMDEEDEVDVNDEGNRPPTRDIRPDIIDDERHRRYGNTRRRGRRNLNTFDDDDAGKQFRRMMDQPNIDEQGNVARQSTGSGTIGGGLVCSSDDNDDDDDGGDDDDGSDKTADLDLSLSENVQSKLHLSDSMEGAVGLSHDCEAELEPPDDDDVTSVVTVETPPSVLTRESIASLFGARSTDETAWSDCQSPLPPLKSFFLAVIDEPGRLSTGRQQQQQQQEEEAAKSKMVLDDHVRGLLASYQRQEGLLNINELYYMCQRAEGSGGETYEKYFVKHRDREFKKFQKRLRLCPQQLLRYCRDPGAAPLLLSSAKVDDLLESRRDVCANCGCDTVFELQILPTAIHVLKVEGIQDWALEFGTVIVYTCRNSCWSSRETASRFVEEKAIVISDPDDVLFDALKKMAE